MAGDEMGAGDLDGIFGAADGNARDYVAQAKATPGGLDWASSGNGTVGHLVGEMWKRAVGSDMMHVPYKGAGPVMIDLVGGQVDLHFASLPAAASGGRFSTVIDQCGCPADAEPTPAKSAAPTSPRTPSARLRCVRRMTRCPFSVDAREGTRVSARPANTAAPSQARTPVRNADTGGCTCQGKTWQRRAVTRAARGTRVPRAAGAGWA